MSLPRFSPKRLKEIADGIRNADGTKKRTGLEDMKRSGLVSRASSFTSKPRKRIKPRAKPKPGQKTQPQVFAEIWAERPHECRVCNAPIDEPTLSNFSHILSKGAYPSMKLDKRNIEIWCADCHHLYTVKDISVVSRPMWKRVHEKARTLAMEANGIEP